MDIIKNVNILDDHDLLLLENHSLDEVYSLVGCTSCNKVNGT